MRDKRGWPAQERYCELPVLLRLLAALHFGVADFARLDQRRDAGMGQVVAVLVHAVSQAFALDPPLAAKLLVVLHAMLLHVLAWRAERRTSEAKDRNEANNETGTIGRHHQDPPLQTWTVFVSPV